MPDKTASPVLPAATIECPLCSGKGALSRAEILDRLGAKDFARVAQLSAEEAFRLLQSKHDRDHQTGWSRFETELAKRTTEIRERHKDEVRIAQSEKDVLTQRVEDCLREVAELRERNHQNAVRVPRVARRRTAFLLRVQKTARTRHRPLGLGAVVRRGSVCDLLPFDFAPGVAQQRSTLTTSADENIKLRHS